MKRRVGLVSTFVMGVLMGSAAWSVPGMQAHAQDASSPSNWWFHGTVEVGGRFFLNNPQKDGRADQNQKSLAKYYEYSSIKPGAFSNIEMSAGTKDGLHQIDFGGYNIGYSDERFFLDYSKAGKQYLTFTWDQTPHVYSKSAQTPYSTNGNQLTLTGCALGQTGPFITTNCEHGTDIAIRRDTAAAAYRWTPTDAWDIKADYSHMRRTGSQIAGVVAGSFSPVQIPRPVADTTQNYGLNGEYVGTSPWGKKLVANLGYTGSQYTDDYSAYYVQSPNNTQSATNALINQISTPPSNIANGFTGTVSADLPWKSRYVGTFNYNMMRQDAAFNSMSTQGAYVLPQASLNGKIDTTLLNNVVTTKIRPDLTNKLSYRYYDFNNGTPELGFFSWIRGDGTTGSADHNVRAISINYTRQNAGDEVVWQPNKQWNIGTAYGYERYDWARVDTNATVENTGKVFADYKPMNWLTARSSVSYGNRRYTDYNYLGNVGYYQWVNSTSTSTLYQSSYRQLMISNRQQWKANFLVDVVVAPGLTLTPTFKYQDDNYGLDGNFQQGLEDRRMWSAGIDSTYVLNPRTTFQLGYSRDFGTQLLFGTNCTNSATTCGLSGSVVTSPNYQAMTNDKATYDTVIATVRHAAIPDKLDTELRYVASHGIDSLQLLLGNNATPSGGQFPDMTTWYQRVDATAIYKFDKETSTKLGLKGQVKAKLRYTWERNSVSWWATDIIGLNQGGGSNILMAADNPNYNVHLIAASLAYSW